MLPLCSLLATLASIGTISYAKARAARCSSLLSVRASPFPGGFRVELGAGLEGKEEGERGRLWKVRSWGGWSLVEDREESV